MAAAAAAAVRMGGLKMFNILCGGCKVGGCDEVYLDGNDNNENDNNNNNNNNNRVDNAQI